KGCFPGPRTLAQMVISCPATGIFLDHTMSGLSMVPGEMEYRSAAFAAVPANIIRITNILDSVFNCYLPENERHWRNGRSAPNDLKLNCSLRHTRIAL